MILYANLTQTLTIPDDTFEQFYQFGLSYADWTMMKGKVCDWRNGEPSFTRDIASWGALIAFEGTFNTCREHARNIIWLNNMSIITPPNTMQILLKDNIQLEVPLSFYETAYMFGLSNSDWTLFKTKCSDWRNGEPSFTGDIGQWALLVAWEGAFNKCRDLARQEIIRCGYEAPGPNTTPKWLFPVITLVVIAIVAVVVVVLLLKLKR